MLITDAKYPSNIFTSPDNVEKEYKELAKKYHPDMNKSETALEEFQALNALYQKSLDNCFYRGDSIKILLNNYKSIKITFLNSTAFELGICYICDTAVVYIIDDKYKKFYDNYVDTIRNIKYADDKMRETFEKLIPKIKKEFVTADNKLMLVLEKTSDMLYLNDVVNKTGIPEKHIVWIISRLYNISCFMNYNGIAHNGITTSNIFISPLYHSVVLYGGWWYTKPIGTKMIGLPKELHNLVLNDEKLSIEKTDLESIRNVGRKLFKADANNLIIRWSKDVSSANPFEDYELWQKRIVDAYGKREFLKWDLTTDKIY